MSSVTNIERHSPPHIAIFPSAGMGHLTPFLRLAAMLCCRNCRVTLITAQISVSTAESTHLTAFLLAYPTINRLEFQIIPCTPPADPTTADPFYTQFEAIIRSLHLITPQLSSTSPPISAIFADITLAAGVCQLADDLNIPNYIVSTTSARFSSFVSYIPYLVASGTSINKTEKTYVQIPGLAPFDISSIPPPLLIPNHIFSNYSVSNSRALTKSKGILLNTFYALEQETMEAVDGGKLIPNIRPFLPIGPLEPHKLEVGDHQPIPWLDKQPPKSVVFVCFGSRTAISRDQIIELGNGLEESGQKFLWVLKSRIVDKEDSAEVEELVGDSFIERMKDDGMLVKGWVNQEEILSHFAIGGFVSHCGWNSVMEAAVTGVPILAWPQIGDQRMNASVVEKAGLGIWDQTWGWLGDKLVKSEEIAKKVTMLMSDQNLRDSANKIGNEAQNAIKVGGSSDKVLTQIIESLQHNDNIRVS